MDKTIITTAALISILSMPAMAQQPAQPTDELVAEARSMVKTFSSSLKQALQAAIKEGGLVNGIGVCNTVAPEIAANNSNEEWTISRTSLKVRNPDNAPTDWQEMQLHAMAKQPVKNGKPVETWQVSEASGQPGFRYMSAIPTQKLCLGCHGKSIDPEVEAKLSELYPEDQATGFSEGDLRGAFVVTRQSPAP
ncbi:Tll0287-like domain-containing protein [Marinobacter orientalis]|uniref:DUF3365 domain-containing protein n=1 Tax=Marinobacter orientalis TaxID=1928859 RepID=A0A7Y0WS52_9GAMM|nr:DUF3365 domain-containing protein [Marinobacter orientalis]NMT63535.1 DUF3365 domain-containing protein [Marinobacter orientalis]TGX48591.1 DUF3365 domain-containing protein [Marinobacter orientalis]